jgi:OOP family OmpA-OmpF porin
MHQRTPAPAPSRSHRPFWSSRSRRSPAALVCGVAACAVAVCAAGPAAADPGFAVPRFQPSFAGDRLFGIQSPYGASENGFMAMALLDYAHAPLVLKDATGKTLGAIVSDQVLLHLDASYAVARAVTFNVDLPIAFQRGEAPSLMGGTAFGQPTATALGDLRLGARAALFGDADDPFQLALATMVWFPTGSRAAYTSDGTVRAQPDLIAGGATRWFVWSASVGYELRQRVDLDLEVPGPGLRWGAGMGFLPGDGSFQIGPEVTGHVPIVAQGQNRSPDAEVLLGARVRFAKHFVTGFGAAMGIHTGQDTPDFRTVLSLAYAPRGVRAADVADRDGDGIPDVEDACPDERGVRTTDPKTNGCPAAAPDRDGDGIPDSEDACPDVRGVRDPAPSINGCPPDRDNDGIPDSEDACPDQMGPRSADPRQNGCPPPSDRDKDGIPDSEDACPDIFGVPDADPKKNGCPVPGGDRDRDGILDDKDACPDDKGPADPDPKKNGCPKDVRVTEGEIVILQQVEFDTGRATIGAVSKGLLDTIAVVLRDHPEILKIEVQGHTDSRGQLEANLILSQQRAEAVIASLEKRGIEAPRLTAKGYGSTRPLMSNVSSAGRQKNRRVEIHILERRAKEAPRKP